MRATSVRLWKNFKIGRIENAEPVANLLNAFEREDQFPLGRFDQPAGQQLIRTLAARRLYKLV